VVQSNFSAKKGQTTSDKSQKSPKRPCSLHSASNYPLHKITLSGLRGCSSPLTEMSVHTPYHTRYKAKLFLARKNIHGGRDLVLVLFTQVPLNSAVCGSDETFLTQLPFAKLARVAEDPLPRADTLRWTCHTARVLQSASHRSKPVNINGKPVHNTSSTGKTRE